MVWPEIFIRSLPTNGGLAEPALFYRDLLIIKHILKALGAQGVCAIGENSRHSHFSIEGLLALVTENNDSVASMMGRVLLFHI